MRLPDQKRMEREAIRILDRLGVQFGSLREKARNLSGEQRQIIAIARAMVRPARLIVVDEPLVALSFSVNKTLLDLIQEWRQSGIAVIIASSSLDDLFAVTDRLAIFRDGQKVAERLTDATNREEVVALVVGSPEHEPVTPIIWALDSYYRARQQAEELHHQQTLLERNLAAQDTLNKQLLEATRRSVERVGQRQRGLAGGPAALDDRARAGTQTLGARAARSNHPGFAQREL